MALKFVQSFFVSLIGGLLEPMHRHGAILFDTVSVVITAAEIELCVCVSLLSGFTTPEDVHHRVFFDTESIDNTSRD